MYKPGTKSPDVVEDCISSCLHPFEFLVLLTRPYKQHFFMFSRQIRHGVPIERLLGLCSDLHSKIRTLSATFLYIEKKILKVMLRAFVFNILNLGNFDSRSLVSNAFNDFSSGRRGSAITFRPKIWSLFVKFFFFLKSTLLQLVFWSMHHITVAEQC